MLTKANGGFPPITYCPDKVNNLDIVTFEDTAELKVRKKDFLTIPEKDAEEKGLLPNIRLLELQQQ